MSTSALLLSLFHHKAWANQELFAELEKLDPQAQQAERHAAIRLLNHIHVVDRIFAAHLAGVPHAYTATNTVETPAFETLRDAVFACDEWYLGFLAGVAPEHLSETIAFTFTDGARGSMSREEMLAHIVTHGSYHRGAVGRIMAQAGVAPPRDIFTVYLHQAEPGRREVS
jgi:uncharacterized damage-inducible protein DinB